MKKNFIKKIAIALVLSLTFVNVQALHMPLKEVALEACNNDPICIINVCNQFGC